MKLITRRQLVRRGAGAALAAAGMAAAATSEAGRKPIRVLIWDEQQPAQKEAYSNFLGNAIADHLRSKGSDFIVQSVKLDDPEQGLSSSNLDAADVLIWWGHVRHNEIKPETGKMLVERIRSGKLNLLALHSAHWSVPFIEAMNARSIDDALEGMKKKDRQRARIRTVPGPRRLMIRGEPLTPSFSRTVTADSTVEVEVKLPSCVFPAVRNDGKPGHIRILLPKHPIAKGVPETWDIPQTEMYDEPFHVPTPDAVILEETWDLGERFRSGCLWKLGKGQVFYFRPGHETYPIFKQEYPLRIVENAVRFLAKK